MKLRIIKIALYLILIVAIYLIFFNKHTPKDDLKKVVEKALSGSRGTYGIVIKNLKTKESYFFNENKIFESGSLYKLWVMAETFRQIQNSTIKIDETLSEDISVLNDKFNIDEESAELTDGTITLSVENALTQMITISHNYAALLLTEKVKISGIKAFLENNNFEQSMIGEPPATTPLDIALFFEKLYQGNLVNPEYSQTMIELLKKQSLNDKLPKYLPLGTQIAHKTGEIGYFSHDAGIVFGKKGDYIIVVLSKTDYPPGAQERIAQISKAVYDYFEKSI